MAEDKKWITFRILLLLLLALIIFVWTEEPVKYEKISEHSKIIRHTETEEVENVTYYELPTENYPIKLENIEDFLSRLLETSKIDKICFRDEGSSLGEHEIFRYSNLTVGINYSQRSEIVTIVDFAGRNLIDRKERCFEIVNRNRITWNWWFETGTKIILQEVEIGKGYTILSPNVQTYLVKVPNVRFYIIKGVLSILFSGAFLWLCTRIIKFIKGGVNS